MKNLFFISLILSACAAPPKVEPVASPTPMVIPAAELVPAPTRSPALQDVVALIEQGKMPRQRYVARPVLSTKDTAKLQGKTAGIKPEQKASNFVQAVGDVDLRSLDTAVRNQGQEGLCTAFAVAAALETNSLRAGKSLNFSERHLWSKYGEYYTESAMTASTRYWIGLETGWPYSRVSAPRPLPVGVGHNNAWAPLETFSAVYAAIASQKPVVMSVTTNTSWSNPYKGVLTTTGRQQGGHAIKVSGYFNTTKGRYLIIKNSWGPGYGDKGYVYLPEAYCAKFWCAFYLINGSTFR